jgi:hypothetical protein
VVEEGVPGVFKEGRDVGRGLGFGAREEINGGGGVGLGRGTSRGGRRSR